MANVRQLVDRFADFLQGTTRIPPRLQLNVTERYLRRQLHLRKREPLVYRGIELTALRQSRPAKFTH